MGPCAHKAPCSPLNGLRTHKAAASREHWAWSPQRTSLPCQPKPESEGEWFLASWVCPSHSPWCPVHATAQLSARLGPAFTSCLSGGSPADPTMNSVHIPTESNPHPKPYSWELGTFPHPTLVPAPGLCPLGRWSQTSWWEPGQCRGFQGFAGGREGPGRRCQARPPRACSSRPGPQGPAQGTPCEQRGCPRPRRHTCPPTLSPTPCPRCRLTPHDHRFSRTRGSSGSNLPCPAVLPRAAGLGTVSGTPVLLAWMHGGPAVSPPRALPCLQELHPSSPTACWSLTSSRALGTQPPLTTTTSTSCAGTTLEGPSITGSLHNHLQRARPLTPDWHPHLSPSPPSCPAWPRWPQSLKEPHLHMAEPGPVTGASPATPTGLQPCWAPRGSTGHRCPYCGAQPSGSGMSPPCKYPHPRPSSRWSGAVLEHLVYSPVQDVPPAPLG